MPDDHVLSVSIHRAMGSPVGPRGLLPSLVAALCVYDAYNGLIPRSWAHDSSRPWNDNAAAVDNDPEIWIGRRLPIGSKL